MSFALGMLAGLIVFLAMAVTGIIAANGVHKTMAGPERPSPAEGGTAPARFPEKEPGSLRSLDLDGDGGLSLAEAAGNAEIVRRFDRADRNRDGRLSQAEFDNLAKPQPPPKASKKKPKPRPAPKPTT